MKNFFSVLYLFASLFISIFYLFLLTATTIELFIFMIQRKKRFLLKMLSAFSKTKIFCFLSLVLNDRLITRLFISICCITMMSKVNYLLFYMIPTTGNNALNNQKKNGKKRKKKKKKKSEAI